MPDSSFISISQAADRLNLTPQAVRDRIRAERLDGHKANGKWRVSEQTVRRAEADRPVKNQQRLAGGADEELQEIRKTLDHLVERDAAAERLLLAVERDRDRFRAEAAASKEAALRINAATEEIDKAVRALLDVLDLQRDALRQFLAPGSPADVLAEPSLTE